MSFRLSKRSRSRLEGVHPDLVKVVEAAILVTEVDFRVNEGVRDIERQRELKASGKSLTIRSKHLIQYDGYGHAVDLVAVGDLDGNGVVDTQDWLRAWDKHWYRAIAKAMLGEAMKLGVHVRWGGNFKDRNGKPWWDGPHFQIHP